MVVHFFLRCAACTATVFGLVFAIQGSAQGFLDLQQQQELERHISSSVVNTKIVYKPKGLQDPAFPRTEWYLGMVIKPHMVVTTAVAFKDPVDVVSVEPLSGGKGATCNIQQRVDKLGVVVLDCPGLSAGPATITKAPEQTGNAVYTVQKEAGFITLITGLFNKKAPAPLKNIFFVAGLDRPGMPLFDYKGRAVGLVIRQGIPLQSRVGVAVEITAVVHEITGQQHQGKGKRIHTGKPAHREQ